MLHETNRIESLLRGSTARCSDRISRLYCCTRTVSSLKHRPSQLDFYVYDHLRDESDAKAATQTTRGARGYQTPGSVGAAPRILLCRKKLQPTSASLLKGTNSQEEPRGGLCGRMHADPQILHSRRRPSSVINSCAGPVGYVRVSPLCKLTIQALTGCWDLKIRYAAVKYNTIPTELYS